MPEEKSLIGIKGSKQMRLTHSQIERCLHENRWRKRHPIEKLSLTIGMLVLSITLPPLPGGLAIALLMIMIAFLIARIPPSTYFRAVAIPFGFALAGAVATIFSVAPGGGGLRITLALNGTAAASGLIMRSLAATSCLSLLLLTTPVTEIVSIFRRCGLPPAICELMQAVNRFIYIFAETAASIWLAQTARCGYASRRNAYRSISRLVAALFIHSLERAGRMEIGISARGYEGDIRWIEPARKLSVQALCGIALLEIGVVALSLSFNGGWRH
jgi:cobalt/nickel transport system permease protein